MIEVEYLDGGREVEPGVFPDPGGSVTKEDDGLGKRESAPDGFGAELFPACAAVSQGADVAGGVGIAHRVPILIGGGLGEDTTEFGFAGPGGAVRLFAFPAGEFPGAKGHAGAIVFKIEDGDGFGVWRRRESGQGFGQVRGEPVDEAVERTRFEFQPGEDVEDVLRLLVGISGVGGGLADELGHRRGMMPGDIQDEVERGAAALAVGVVKVTAFERDGAKQGVNVDGAVVVDGFAGQREGVVGDESTVVEQLLDDAAGIPGKGVAQADFEPLGQVFVFFFLGEFLASLGEKALCFAVFFGEVLGLEVFFSVSAAVDPVARRAMVCWMLSWASCWQSCSKRWKLPMSSRRSRASSAVTLRVWL